MTPRHLTAWIAQRSAKAFAVAALALGVSATVLAPVTAQAAPLSPRPGPTYGPDLVVSVSPGAPRQRLQTIAAVVRLTNQGSSRANGSRVNVTFPEGFTDIKITRAGGQYCSVYGNTATCTATSLEPGDYMEIYVGANAPATQGVFILTAVADPDNLVQEGRESNNTATAKLVVI